VAVGVVSGVAVAASLSSGATLPLLTRAWDGLASSLSTWLPPSARPQPPLADAGPANGDAAAPPHRQTAPLSSAQLGAPLVHGAFVSACGAPDAMKVVVKATVKMGRAMEVTVKTDPPNSAVASCVEHAVRDLQWDVTPKADHVTVTY
jgi:hypothetical protein